MKFTYIIEGMHCVSCVGKIKTALSAHNKVLEVSLNPPLLTIEALDPPLISELNNQIAIAGNYRLRATIETPVVAVSEETNQGLWAYYPIILIAVYILGISVINNMQGEIINWSGMMSQFMAGFFLVFSAFKFLDLSGFAEGYATYDLLARKWYAYGYIYPFLELGLGLLYLTHAIPVTTQLLTIVIMGFSSLGVINSLLKKQKLRCACLGTILKVPLSTVTLTEDLLMVILATVTLVDAFLSGHSAL